MSQVKSQLIVMNLVKSPLIVQSLITVDLHESSQVTADRPESRHISTDREHPETCHSLSAAPGYSRSVLSQSGIPCILCVPLVSARAAGISKPTHSSSPVPELIPLSEVLPMMGIAF